jgi:hypothetical protein
MKQSFTEARAAVELRTPGIETRGERGREPVSASDLPRKETCGEKWDHLPEIRNADLTVSPFFSGLSSGFERRRKKRSAPPLV